MSSHRNELVEPERWVKGEACDYKPLETPTTIRLLELFHGTKSDILKGRIRHINLNSPGYFEFNPLHAQRSREQNLSDAVRPRLASDSPVHDSGSDCPPYEALSYVWGIAHKACPLFTDQGIIWITSNLGLALRRIRLSTRTRVVWADGVCINQDDVLERGHQVKIMSSVYRKAFRVLVWLGPDPLHQAEATFDAVHQAGRLHATNDTLRKLVSMSITCSWFGRIWVLQEVYFAHAAVAIWGEETIDFHGIAELMSALRHNIPHTTSWVVQLFRNEIGALDLLYVLSSIRSLRCFDPRDRIYALINMPYHDQEAIREIEPDYNVEWNDLYYRVACGFVKSGRVFDLLASVSHGFRLEDSPKGLPSWVPNWADNPEVTPFPFAAHNCRKSASMAWIDDESRSLHVQGFDVDTICATSDPFSRQGIDAYDIPVMTLFWGMSAKFSSLKPELEHLCFCEALMCGELWGKMLGYDTRLRLSVWLFLRSYSSQYLGRFSKLRDWMLTSVLLAASELLESISGFDSQPNERDALSPSLIKGRRLFRTLTGLIGLGPACMEQGDRLAILTGSEIPVILRPLPCSHLYQFIGVAYVSGLMYEDENNLSQDMRREYRTFQIQ